MLEQEKKREHICDLLSAGVDKKTISYIVDVSLRTVSNVSNNINNNKGTTRAPGSGGQNKKTTDKFVEQLRMKIEDDPMVSMRRLAKDCDVAKGTIRRTAKND